MVMIVMMMIMMMMMMMMMISVMNDDYDNKCDDKYDSALNAASKRSRNSFLFAQRQRSDLLVKGEFKWGGWPDTTTMIHKCKEET